MIFALLIAMGCFSSKKLSGYVFGTLVSLAIVAGVAWFVLSVRMPAKIQSTTRHSIKTVVYPDGTKKQMFSIDGKHLCANEIWHKMIDEESEEVEYVVPVTDYLGLTYSDMSPQYHLVKKAVK
jgi:hypothetical protein